MVNKYVQAVSYANGADVLDKCVNAFSLIFQIPPYFMPSFKPVPFFFGIGAGVIFKIIMDARKKNAKQFRHGEEYGSAKWGTEKDFEPYTDPVKWNNIPLTATEWLRMTRPEHPKYDRNKNILVVGGSGAGKTRGFVKPSLMQMQCSYVVTGGGEGKDVVFIFFFYFRGRVIKLFGIDRTCYSISSSLSSPKRLATAVRQHGEKRQPSRKGQAETARQRRKAGSNVRLGSLACVVW